jgi:phytanoyl-CoA hydroxylase
MSKAIIPHFELGEQLTQEQKTYFDKNGVILFKHFLPKETVELYKAEVNRVAQQMLSEGIDKVNGTPLKFGYDLDGSKMIQRICFTNHYSDMLQILLKDPRLHGLAELLGPYEGRIGHDEKDGLVTNQYVNAEGSKFTHMGWHTDSPRDLFLGQKIMPMLNIGIHLDQCLFEDGGLRVIPGTHKQGMFKLMFGKKYFIDHKEDPREVGFDIEAGDLSVHDGRTWHRAQSSPHQGERSRRRVMYVPLITGKYMPKDKNSKTPFYHKLANKVHT